MSFEFLSRILIDIWRSFLFISLTECHWDLLYYSLTCPLEAKERKDLEEIILAGSKQSFFPPSGGGGGKHQDDDGDYSPEEDNSSVDPDVDPPIYGEQTDESEEG